MIHSPVVDTGPHQWIDTPVMMEWPLLNMAMFMGSGGVSFTSQLAPILSEILTHEQLRKI